MEIPIYKSLEGNFYCTGYRFFIASLVVSLTYTFGTGISYQVSAFSKQSVFS
jgi:hypothetical protein